MANQVDITPGSNPALGLYVHVQNGQSASAVNNPSDFPSVKAQAGAGIKTVQVTVAGVRFSNPS
jgi:hypothetical protein